jgi:hypothetical protein
MNEEPASRHEQFLRQYSAHEPAIRAFVRRLVPSRDDVPDVMQEVALVLWKKFQNLTDPGDFRRCQRRATGTRVCWVSRGASGTSCRPESADFTSLLGVVCGGWNGCRCRRAHGCSRYSFAQSACR